MGCEKEREDEEKERAEELMERTRVTEEWNVQRERENGGGKRRFKQTAKPELDSWNPKPG